MNGHELRLKRVSENDDLAQLGVHRQVRHEPRAGNRDARNGKAVLTVADAAGFCKAGGIIEFAVDNDQRRFEINLDSAQRSRLDVSSTLLTLAKVVHSTRPAGGQ